MSTIKQAVSDEETRILWQTRDGMQGFLRELRNRGAFQVESIKAVCQLADSCRLARRRRSFTSARSGQMHAWHVRRCMKRRSRRSIKWSSRMHC